MSPTVVGLEVGTSATKGIALDERGAVLARAEAAHVLLPKDHVRLRLTGEHATDVADAPGTLWPDVGARTWSDEVLSRLGADPAWLPRVLESPAVNRLTRDGGIPVDVGARVETVAAWSAPYREARGRYRALYPALRDVHSTIP